MTATHPADAGLSAGSKKKQTRFDKYSVRTTDYQSLALQYIYNESQTRTQKIYIYGSVQNSRNSIANKLEWCLFSIEP